MCSPLLFFLFSLFPSFPLFCVPYLLILSLLDLVCFVFLCFAFSCFVYFCVCVRVVFFVPFLTLSLCVFFVFLRVRCRRAGSEAGLGGVRYVISARRILKK